MFTGIVQRACPVSSIEREEGMIHLTVDLGAALAAGLERGASVSVAGTCLTAVDFDLGAGWVRFDVIAESLRRTTLGELAVGHLVNIERAASIGDEIGGHLLSGHVHGVAEVVDVTRPTNNHEVTMRVDPEVHRFIFSKGYIALDGCSLTVVDVDRDASTFSVHLIPETLERTTFGAREVGDRVNVEVDAQTLAVVETVDAALAARGLT
jgi:riboflavin synthase